MKIGLSFVTLASAAVLALSGAAQAHISKSQALAAQMQAVKAAALWYPAGASYFNKTYQSLAKQQFPTRHPTRQSSLPSNMRGQDQLSTPGWSGELPF